MATATPVAPLLEEVVDGVAGEVVVSVGAVVATNAFPGIDAKVGVPSVFGAVSGLVIGLPLRLAAAAAEL